MLFIYAGNKAKIKKKLKQNQLFCTLAVSKTRCKLVYVRENNLNLAKPAKVCFEVKFSSKVNTVNDQNPKVRIPKTPKSAQR